MQCEIFIQMVAQVCMYALSANGEWDSYLCKYLPSIRKNWDSLFFKSLGFLIADFFGGIHAFYACKKNLCFSIVLLILYWQG